MTVVSTIDPEEYGITEFTESIAKPLTRDELLTVLNECAGRSNGWRDDCSAGDPEHDHWRADMALLAYIGDPEIIQAYEAVYRWYA